jgi:hypothetical protein
MTQAGTTKTGAKTNAESLAHDKKISPARNKLRQKPSQTPPAEKQKRGQRIGDRERTE